MPSGDRVDADGTPMQQTTTAVQQDGQNADAGLAGENSAVAGGMQDDDDENMAEGLGAADANQ